MKHPTRATAGLAAVCALVCAAAAFFTAASRDPVYESSAEVSDYLALRKGAELRGDLFSLEVVARLTADTVDPPLTPAEVKRRVTVSSPTRDGRRMITATAARAPVARNVAAAYARQYISHRENSLSARFRDQRRALRSQLRGLDRRKERARIRDQIALLRLRERRAPQSRISQQASLPDSPARPKPWRNALIALVVGALLALLVRRLASRLDRTGDTNAAAAAWG